MNTLDFFASIVVLILTIICVYKNKKLIIYENEILFAILLILFCAIISCFAGVSLGDSLYGVGRIGMILVWLLFLMQCTSMQREQLLLVVPHIAAFMVWVSMSFLVFPPTHLLMVEENGRLLGFFSYANTAGLFLLLGWIILLMQNEKNTGKKSRYLRIAELVTILLGMLWTGSRTTLIIAVIATIWLAIQKKISFGSCLLGVVSTVICVLGYALITQDLSHARNLSTFWGRILYWKDALLLIRSHPLGLGYLGYFFSQESIQTGLYTTRFVHNEWLQSALDYGWIACGVMVVVFAMQWKKNKGMNRWIITIIACHCVMDMDLQFLLIDWILITAMNISDGKKLEVKWQNSLIKSLLVLYVAVGGIAFGWLGIAQGLMYVGDYSLADALVPNRVETKEMLILGAIDNNDVKEVRQESEELLKNNEMDVLAYDALTLVAEAEGDNIAMLQYKRQAVGLQPYNLEEYEDYVARIDYVATLSEQTENEAMYQECVSMMKDVEQLLVTTEKKTSSLAYRLNDVPSFTMQDEYQKMMERYLFY